jgi:SAM-dependent methyltransferase
MESEVRFEDFDSMVQIYEDPERKNWQSPDLVLQKMGDVRETTIADIGIGTGYFAFRLINLRANVIGIDIDQRFLDYIEERKSELSPEVAARLTTRLSEPESPALETSETDWILIVNTYHFLTHRVSYLKKLYEALKPGGKIMIVDFRKGSTPVGPAESDKVAPAITVSELKNAGFRLVDLDENSLQYQYIIIASKP